MTNKDTYLNFALLSLLMSNSYPFAENKNDLKPEDINVNIEKPIPKGCKRYYYNDEGICSKSQSKVYFDALKPSTARKKYLKWKENNGN